MNRSVERLFSAGISPTPRLPVSPLVRDKEDRASKELISPPNPKVRIILSAADWPVL